MEKSDKDKTARLKALEIEGLGLLQDLLDQNLGMVYIPASEATKLNTHVPDAMAPETTEALERIKNELGGDIDNFVRARLGYFTKADLFNVLSAEQIDAVAMTIYNIEARGQGLIIGDQTGIGKGRIAAAVIRYAVKLGLKPIFLTEKANLFSDLYRDLAAIGSGSLRPLIINSKEEKTDIKDEEGEVLFEAPTIYEQAEIFETQKIPDDYNFVMATYSQFNSPFKKPTKPNYLREIAANNILILDECHNASGGGNTSRFMQSIVESSKGVAYLSATFAKRPDNMPIYALKTAISEANLSKSDLVRAINKGGVPLQEILSSQLVAVGQMIRRERSYEGIEVNYIYLNEYEKQHSATSDKITQILRDIIKFQIEYVNPKISAIHSAVIAEKSTFKSNDKKTFKVGAHNMPYFSKVFNVINQMLFSVKAEAVANRAIARLNEGKKPIIAFSSTMGSFVEEMKNDDGEIVKDGDAIRSDFSEVFYKGIESILKYTIIDAKGHATHKKLLPSDLTPEGRKFYENLQDQIDNVSTGISISPIDVIIQKIENAGYTVGEVTGRKLKVELKSDKGIIRRRKRILTNDAYRQFNDNELDVLLINQAGSTGSSAQAIPTVKVPADQVKQRVMIVLQADLDISIEIQKRGRINRTGQIMLPIYDYLISPIPAEKRMMMMLQKKLKSLDANTTSNQKQSSALLDVPDFLNKYGNQVVEEYLEENSVLEKELGYPLETVQGHPVTEQAHKVSGRIAILPVDQQALFYSEITDRYNDYIEYLKQMGEYDLEVEVLDLKAETLRSSLFKVGKGGDSSFGEDSKIETVEINMLKKPYKALEVENLINEALNGMSPDELVENLTNKLKEHVLSRINDELDEINAHYDHLIKEVPNDKKIKKLEEDNKAYAAAIERRLNELEEERLKDLENAQAGNSYRAIMVARLFSFFKVGRKINYPLGSAGDTALAICLGVNINYKRKNPFARSAIKVRFAIANSLRYVTVPASNDAIINLISGLNSKVETPDRSDLLIDWAEEVQKRNTDRGVRFMITGNILQAFDDERGKLVSYTTSDGEVKKGILKPEGWEPNPERSIRVPILKALKVLTSMVNNSSIHCSDSMSIFRVGDSFRLTVSADRAEFLGMNEDTELIELLYEEKFIETEDDLQAIFFASRLETVAEILQRKYSLSLKLKDYQLNWVDTSKTVVGTRNKIEIPELVDEEELERLRLLELEAEAIAIGLELGI